MSSPSSERLESPEERLGKSIGLREKVLLLWGPGIVALGASIGSGEFLLGPAAATRVGLGIAWITLIGAFLQSVYLYSWVRLVIAYGETPIAMMFRISALLGVLGALFVPLTFAWGSWAYLSASAFTSLIVGGVPTAPHADLTTVVGMALLFFTFLALNVGHRVARTLEVLNWASLGIIFPAFIVLAILLVPLSTWGELIMGIVSFGYMPPKVDLATLGTFWGYTAYAAGVSYILANYFKDKGYGMGAKTGFIPGTFWAKETPVSPSGRLFSLTPENLRAYEKWISLAREEVLIFFSGALIGMWIPMALAYAAANELGIKAPYGVPAWLGLVLQEAGWGYAGFVAGTLIAILVLLKVQLGMVDAVGRALVDALWRLEGVRRLAGGDVRVVYYGTLLVYILWSSLVFLVDAPILLILVAINAANAGALIGVPALLYLNYRVVPKELRLHPALVVLNVIFMVLCLVFLGAAIGRILG
ncbi:MAG: Nramp family divalent metal transporter [Acidilobaceae archaeon]|nr:Nramp family divalent metal transporter [Acidilobaceae archaeon]